jgi:hypothetical protein
MKKPLKDGWQDRIVASNDVGRYFGARRMNVGVQLGPRSGGLTDADLDCAEAIRLAPHFLPPTEAVFGRKSKRRSHWLYVVDDALDKATIKYVDPDGKTVVELRLGGSGKGAHTVFPGSTHQSGEPIEWDEDGEPARSSFDALARATVKIFVGTMAMRTWPSEGNRHTAAQAIGGFLARACWDVDEIGDFVEKVVAEAGDDEVSDRVTAARAQAEAYGKRENTYGLPTLGEVFGLGVAKPMAEAVGYRETDDGFEAGDKGLKARSQRNIRTAMDRLGVRVRYDRFHDRALITGLEGHDVLDDHAMEKLWLLID